MSESQASKVILFDNSDPVMQKTYEIARATFRYFWREVAWDRRRILPALDLITVKAPFSDGEQGTRTDGNPDVEHMWLTEVDFDGQHVSGVLLNAPNWLTKVKEGESVRIPIADISDWMYTINDVVFGAYTVSVMRSRMGRQERQAHDDAWGLDFGDPTSIRVVPGPNQGAEILNAALEGRQAEAQEHPLSEGMAASLKERLMADPSLLIATDDNGWTLLHQEALAGSAATVKVLLEAGADRHAVTGHGMTPLKLAQSLGWGHVAALLESR